MKSNKLKIINLQNSKRYRISVYRSNKYLNVFLIDDIKSTTIISKTTKTIKSKITPTQKATEIGIIFAESIKKEYADKCVFDKNGYKYHGKVKAVAESIRNNGIKI